MDNPSIHYQKNNKVDIMHESYFEDQVLKLLDEMNHESRSFRAEIDNNAKRLTNLGTQIDQLVEEFTIVEEEQIDEDEDPAIWAEILEEINKMKNENQSINAMINSNAESLVRLETQLHQLTIEITRIEEEDKENSVEEFKVITLQNNESHAKVITFQNNEPYNPPILYKRKSNTAISSFSKTTLQNANSEEEGYFLMPPKKKIKRVLYDPVFPKALQGVRKKRKVEEYYYYYPP